MNTSNAFPAHKKTPEPNVKRRSSRACDNCRKTKSKCDRMSEDDPCESCFAQGLECTFTGPVGKRGPAKGYLHAVETRCHAVEAVLGILLSLPDERAISLLQEISEDRYARNVLEQVNVSAFGPRGRTLPASSPNDAMQDAIDPFAHGPTNGWQDTVIAGFQIRSGRTNLQPFGLMSSRMSTAQSPDPSTQPQEPTVKSRPESPASEDGFHV